MPCCITTCFCPHFLGWIEPRIEEEKCIIELGPADELLRKGKKISTKSTENTKFET